jgi:hypothetical protein
MKKYLLLFLVLAALSSTVQAQDTAVVHIKGIEAQRSALIGNWEKDYIMYPNKQKNYDKRWSLTLSFDSLNKATWKSTSTIEIWLTDGTTKTSEANDIHMERAGTVQDEYGALSVWYEKHENKDMMGISEEEGFKVAFITNDKLKLVSDSGYEIGLTRKAQ